MVLALKCDDFIEQVRNTLLGKQKGSLLSPQEYDSVTYSIFKDQVHQDTGFLKGDAIEKMAGVARRLESHE